MNNSAFCLSACVDTELNLLPVVDPVYHSKHIFIGLAGAWGTRTLCNYANQDFCFGFFSTKKLDTLAENQNSGTTLLCR